MKKTVIFLSSILIIIFVALSFINIKDEYSAEKALWMINRHYVRLTKNPDTIPAATFEEVADRYRQFRKDYSNSELSGKAQIIIGSIYLFKKDFPKAREEFELVKKYYPNAVTFNSEALSAIARSYEMENNWPQALSTYRELIKKYPKTKMGFTIPIYIAQYYQNANQIDQARMAYSDAISFYRNLANENPNSGVEYNSLRLIALSYLYQKNWSEGMNALSDLLMKYPNLVANINQVIPAVNSIAVNQTKDYDSAIKIYQRFIDAYPQHPINNTLKAVIKNFEDLKTKNSSPTAATK